MTRILVSDKLAPEGVQILREADGVTVDVKTELSRDQLARIIGDYDGIIVRSATKLDADLIGKAAKLRAIARAGVGIDNIDVLAASRRGVIVMNTPGGNTTSTAEHTVALMMAMSRNVYPAARSLKEGRWDRKKFTGTQLEGKTIGVIGLGRVGETVASRAKGLGMTVIGYDPYLADTKGPALGIETCDDLDEVFARSDYVTVHTPLTDETRGLIGADAIAKMKDGVRVINCARGGIVDNDALLAALESGKVAGAAVDVYETEPPEDRRLVEHPNVLCTPHLGASTEEAQVKVAVDGARQLLDALSGRQVRFAVNAPMMDWSKMPGVEPFARLGFRLGELVAQLAESRIRKLDVTVAGDIPADAEEAITSYALVAVLRKLFRDPINLVNARVFARESRIDVQTTRSADAADFAALVSARIVCDDEEHVAGGALFQKDEPRIVMIDGFAVEAIPAGDLLVIFDKDRPGLVGCIGSTVGAHGINIARMTFGRKDVGGSAIVVLNLDRTCEADLNATAAKLAESHQVRLIRLSGAPSAWAAEG